MSSKNKMKASKTPQVADFVYEQPYDLRHRFRNLKDPLKFIESDQIKKLQKNYANQKNELAKEQQLKADFSKSIYKKVISRDNEYNFQNKIMNKAGDQLIELYNQKSSKAGNRKKTAFQKTKKEDLERHFKHGEIISMQQKKQRMREESETPLTFAHVKLIDTPQFQSLKDVQFYSLLRGQGQNEFTHSGGNSEIDNVRIQAHIQNFKHSLIASSQYQSKTSYNFLFDCNRELKFWRLQNIFKDEKKSDEDVLSTCAFLDPSNISMFQMFDFSTRNIEIADVIRFYKLKSQLQAKMEMDKNNESLEEKYNEAKKRFEEMKQNRLKSKNQRLPAKFISSVAQTNDQMQQRDFQDYFVQDASSIFDKLQQLNLIRDRIVEQEEGETFQVMATNIGIQIGKELFKLLMLVLKGQNIPNYNQFMRASNEQQIERKILQLIYLQFKNFAAFEVDGTSKVQIIKRYLQQREKNQRFYETHLLKKNIQKKK